MQRLTLFNNYIYFFNNHYFYGFTLLKLNFSFSSRIYDKESPCKICNTSKKSCPFWYKSKIHEILLKIENKCLLDHSIENFKIFRTLSEKRNIL